MGRQTIAPYDSSLSGLGPQVGLVRLGSPRLEIGLHDGNFSPIRIRGWRRVRRGTQGLVFEGSKLPYPSSQTSKPSVRAIDRSQIQLLSSSTPLHVFPHYILHIWVSDKVPARGISRRKKNVGILISAREVKTNYCRCGCCGEPL